MKLPRRQFEASIPSVAMGDIAFLLLIFFVILARAQNDDHISWKPASAEDLSQAPATAATVTIGSDFKLHLNGRSTSAAALPGALEAILAGRPAGARTVHLKVDREATAPTFEPVIEAISSAGGEIIHILEPEPEPQP